MKPSIVRASLRVLIAARQPTIIWGPPGAGKSSVVKQASEEYGGGFIDARLALFDAVDMRGLPSITDKGTVWHTPDFLPRKGKGVLFLDELPQAQTIVQNAASQLILDRRIGNYILPDGWVVIAAGNRESDRAATNRMPSHIANRFVHLQFEVDTDDWLAWAQANDVHPMVIAFIAFRPALLHAFDPKAKAFPTPRSWEFVSKILYAAEDLDNGLLEIIEGTVGEKAAVEFIGFMKIFREMPDYETIKSRPEGTKIPDNIAARVAVGTMLARRAQPGDMGAIMKYVNRMQKEFQLLTITEMTTKNPRLTETAAYINWAAKNKDIMLNATVR